MPSQTRISLVPFVPRIPLSPIVSPLPKKYEPFMDITKRLVRLEDTVSGLQKEKEKELRDMKALKEQKDLKEQKRIKNEAERLLDNLNKGQVYSENSMEKRMISLPGPIEYAVFEELYRLEKSIHYKSSSDLFEGKQKIFYSLFSFPNKENTEDTDLAPEKMYPYKVNESLQGNL